MAAKGKKHRESLRSPRPARQSGRDKPSRVAACPWTHWLLALLAAIFLLAAVGQVFAGAVQAAYAAWSADPELKELSLKAAQVDEITLKRSVQKAYRDSGLYVPLEDVILTHRINRSPQGSPENRQKSFEVLVALPFRVPWAGTFVYTWSRKYSFE